MHSLSDLHHAAKEILAAAFLELFPTAKMIGGGHDTVTFYYEFFFDEDKAQLFKEKELITLEDQMRLIVHQNRPFTFAEMMRENAENFFTHIRQEERAFEIAGMEDNVVPLFKMGEFADVCPAIELTSTGSVKHLKLLSYQLLDPSTLRIEGTACYEKDQLKEFLKKYKDAKKRDPMILGPSLGLFDRIGEHLVFLPKGEVLVAGLIEKWREMHKQLGFGFLHVFDMHDPQAIHYAVFEREGKKLPLKLASIGPADRDLATIFCRESDLLEELISSLQFIEKVIKIFGFETKIYLVGSKRKEEVLLKEALTKSGLSFIEERGARGKIEFALLDLMGREFRGPKLMLEREKETLFICRSLIGSFTKWTAMMVEGVKRV